MDHDLICQDVYRRTNCKENLIELEQYGVALHLSEVVQVQPDVARKETQIFLPLLLFKPLDFPARLIGSQHGHGTHVLKYNIHSSPPHSSSGPGWIWTRTLLPIWQVVFLSAYHFPYSPLRMINMVTHTLIGAGARVCVPSL